MSATDRRTATDRRAASAPIHDVRTVWDARIRVRDGIELSANLWLPVPRADAPDQRFPAILEMIPYGKDNWRRNSDVGRGEWLAARGYALCRVDVRGTGSSGGIALDEYTADETQDGYEAVEWLAAQPWCNGNVGMWGISYGGFTSIQVAALRPPHLRAIVPVMATDDRYTDDVHFRGGCLTVSEQSQYAVSQVAMNAMPPDPGVPRRGLAFEWLARLEATPPWTLEWLRHQTDGPYWRVGSLAPDYDRIEAAILGIGGWMDSYVDPAFRMQERCTSAADRRVIVGSWGHGLPDSAEPGPPMDWLHEMVRFFDRHLRGIDNGLDAEPPVVWFQREWTEPDRIPCRAQRAVAGRGCVPSRGHRVTRMAAGRWFGPDGRSAGGRPGRRGDGRRHRPGRPSADPRHRGRPVVGRRRSAERHRRGPPSRRGAQPHVHL